MTDALAAIEALEEALARAEALVAPEALEPFAATAEHARRRRGFLGETVVAALVGGTGSGKSSVLNAVAGEEVAAVSALRPTTDQPLAWLPAEPEPGVVRLLDDLGVDRRHGHRLGWSVALVDLPDFDSVEWGHRATVEALLPRIDAVVWILDPQKYSDRLIHREYIAPLSGYQDQFVFVLNQVDRLRRDADVSDVLADLRRTLAAEGITDPQIFVTAADPPHGPARGIDELVAHMQQAWEAKRVVVGKLIEDVRRAGEGIAAAAGISDQPDLDAAARWTAARNEAGSVLLGSVAGAELAEAGERAGRRLAARRGSGPLGRGWALVRGSRLGRAAGAQPDDGGAAAVTGRWAGRVGLERAVADISGCVTDVSVEVGGHYGARLRNRFGPEVVEKGVRAAVEGALVDHGRAPDVRGRWWWPPAGVLQTVLLVTLVAGAVWLWADPDPFQRGEWPWAAILAGGSLVLSVLVAALVRGSGRRAGRRAVSRYRRALSSGLERRLDDAIGGPFVEALAVRRELAEALARVEAATRDAARELSRT